MVVNVEVFQEAVAPLPSGADDKTQKAWTEQVRLFRLLGDQRTASWIILYGSGYNKGSLVLHSLLVPARDLAGQGAENLSRWGLPHGTWGCGLVYGGGQPARVEFSEPITRIGDVVLSTAKMLVFGRGFDGRSEDRHYYEIAQFLTHANEIHWTPERRAWCRFDDNGDIEDVIRWTEIDRGDGRITAVCIQIKREILEQHMSATGDVLVQMFDSVVISDQFSSWGHEQPTTTEVDEHLGLYYRQHLEGTNGSYVRGVQIIAQERTSEEFGELLFQRMNAPKQYESFITRDVKNRLTTTISCSPDALASYFEQDSPLPLQISPVFFSAQVLDKYKADPEKYSLEHRSITCRNSWHLKTYDVNDEGQVHTYIKYLGDLPYTEQVYWKSFNQAPRAPISKRAFTTDIKGEFDTESDPLRDLKHLVRNLNQLDLPWFKVRDTNLVEQLHYPLTDSPKIWGDALVNLAKVVVEGLEKKYFAGRAKQLGAEGDSLWGSIRWVKEFLIASNVDNEVIGEVVDPPRKLQELRTKLGAHSGGDEAAKLRAKLLRDFKSPRGHITHLSGELHRSLKLLADIVAS